jgi:YD repeat-containing protein
VKTAAHLLLVASLWAQVTPRQSVYANAVMLGGQAVPLFDKGYLIYLHRPNRLQVFRPDTKLAYELDVPCPAGANTCSAAGVGVSATGTVAVGIGYLASHGYTSGIRWLDSGGGEIRFTATDRYVPVQLTFDHSGNLWTMGWTRDRWLNDRASEEPCNIVRKYSAEGKLLGEYLPTTLWNLRHGPALGGRGYWTMYAAADRIGALINDSFANRTPEWVEWDLNGRLVSRTAVGDMQGMGRGFTSDGRLYAQFRGTAGIIELRVLDVPSGLWKPARTNLPERMSAFLLGADGKDLVYRINQAGSVHLIWARPEAVN